MAETWQLPDEGDVVECFFIALDAKAHKLRKIRWYLVEKFLCQRDRFEMKLQKTGQTFEHVDQFRLGQLALSHMHTGQEWKSSQETFVEFFELLELIKNCER